jgi:hypothetical protein
MEPITFETLPSAVSKLCLDVEDIKRLLQIKNEPQTEISKENYKEIVERSLIDIK